MKKKIHGMINNFFSAMKRNKTVVLVVWRIQWAIHLLLSFLVLWFTYKLAPDPLSLKFVVIYEPVTAAAIALFYFFLGGMITIFLIGDIPMFILVFIYQITEEPFNFTIEKIEMEKLPPNKRNSD